MTIWTVAIVFFTELIVIETVTGIARGACVNEGGRTVGPYRSLAVWTVALVFITALVAIEGVTGIARGTSINEGERAGGSCRSLAVWTVALVFSAEHFWRDVRS